MNELILIIDTVLLIMRWVDILMDLTTFVIVIVIRLMDIHEDAVLLSFQCTNMPKDANFAFYG